jgi:hypothetical protein
VPTRSKRSTETRTFYTNTPFEKIEIAVDAVVPLEAALAAATAFFCKPSLPSGLAWLEL